MGIVSIDDFARGKNAEDFCRLLIGIYKKLGTLIGSAEPIAAEIICCEIIGFNPDDVPMIRTAKKI